MSFTSIFYSTLVVCSFMCWKQRYSLVTRCTILRFRQTIGRMSDNSFRTYGIAQCNTVPSSVRTNCFQIAPGLLLRRRYIDCSFSTHKALLNILHFLLPQPASSSQQLSVVAVRIFATMTNDDLPVDTLDTSTSSIKYGSTTVEVKTPSELIGFQSESIVLCYVIPL